MLLRKAYYAIKPFVPWGLRAALRRGIIRLTEHKHVARWPVDPVSWRPPHAWPGWPNGKKFAVILTHDVESAKGVANVPQLMELEKRAGFKSSFNFVPEGYQTPPELRKQLTSEGFEVGIHDLKHDGKLYSSRAHFEEAAKRINAYVKEWGVAGFRSAFMLHNLEWLKDLDVEYDLSTFDTDPFEPQPDGMRTIFPFWVEGKNGRGYMELPYTLPQDSTLFVYGGHEDAKLWCEKVDWLVEQGGMVLVNVHPDYLHFGPGSPGNDEFPDSIYDELLRYIRTKYEGQYWHALPREVARYCSPFKPQKPVPSGRKVCLVSYSFYESDNRVHRYGDALAERGDEVHVICVGGRGILPRHQVNRSAYVWRIQNRIVDERGFLDYAWRLCRFSVAAFLALARNYVQYRYDVCHIHSVPDTLVFTAAVPKLFGSKIILDVHDILPEFYASKFKSGLESPAVELMRKAEWASCRFSDHVIIANDLWFDTITSRSIAKEDCTAFINYVDLVTFAPRPRQRPEGKIVVLFPGGLQWHQGLDIAIRAFAIFHKEFPNSEFHIYGDGVAKLELNELARDLGVGEKVLIRPAVRIEDVPQLMADADIGVVPKRADSFGNEAYSTKIMEFMSQRLPVVCSRTRIDSFYFPEDVVSFFESGNTVEMAEKMAELIRNPTKRRKLAENAWTYIQNYSWNHKKFAYLNLVDQLLAKTQKVVANGHVLHPRLSAGPLHEASNIKAK